MTMLFRGSADAGPRECVMVVTAGPGQKERLAPRLDLRNHSPTGFGWGYAGSGPAQLALAILARATGDDRLATELYQEFKQERIAALPMDRDWTITGDEVLAWVRDRAPVAAAGGPA